MRFFIYCITLGLILSTGLRADQVTASSQDGEVPICITVGDASPTWCLKGVSNEVIGGSMLAVAVKANGITGSINSGQMTRAQIESTLQRVIGNYVPASKIKTLREGTVVLSKSKATRGGIILLFVGGAATLMKDSVVVNSNDMEILDVEIVND